MTVTSRRSAIAGVTLVAVTLPLAACGGGGGGVRSTPAPPIVVPVPPPPPTPPPPPPPPPPGPASYSAKEYSDSNAATSINAAVAYATGATGAGITVGIVDSGIDESQVEFTGRISPASRAFGGNSSIQDPDGHGTEVAGIIGAAANGRNTLGVAFNSTLLVLRTDKPGSCAETGEDKGCSHPDSNIAAAVDFAAQSGARVVNISLGGSEAAPVLRAAINRATAAGVVIVISAGNDGEETKGLNPDPLAQIAADPVAHGLVIIAGSLGQDVGNGVVDDTVLSLFSNKAGSFAPFYLSALGFRVRTVDNQNQAVRASGTSFAAPVVSGALALLFQAFPNLTAAQAVDLVFRTARDLGDPGVDAIYGHGGLDLTRAFQPQGAMTLAGSTQVIESLDGGRLGSAMGDGGRMTGLSAVALDSYGRAYDTPLSLGTRTEAARSSFASVLREGQRMAGVRTGANGLVAVSVESAAGAHPLALREADAVAARATALAFVQRLDGRTRLSLGIARGAEGLTARLDAAREGAFLVAGRADRQSGLLRDPDAAVAVSRDLGGIRLNVAAESGRSLATATPILAGQRAGWDRSGYSSLFASLDGRLGPAGWSLGATRMSEDAAILGARLNPALVGGRGADSWFLDAGATVPLGAGFSVGGAYRRGWTIARAGGALTGGTLASDAWSLDLAKAGLWGDDLLSLRLSQPLRVSGGGLNLTLPTGYDYATLTPGYGDRRLDLRPLGAERVAEVAYARPLWIGSLSFNGYWRQDPGNNARQPDDKGALVRWSAGF